MVGRNDLVEVEGIEELSLAGVVPLHQLARAQLLASSQQGECTPARRLSQGGKNIVKVVHRLLVSGSFDQQSYALLRICGP
jgi:hypothetical protein